MALLAVATAGCATSPAPRAGPGSDDDLAGWQALADGRRADAQALFERRLRAAARDPIALFGRASIDYERGASEAAIDGYVAMLRALHEAPDGAVGLGALVAPVAAGRVLTLYDEIGAVARRRTIDRLAPWIWRAARSCPGSRAWSCSAWPSTPRARSATRRSSRASRALSGCVTAVVDLGVIGPLASADLDAAAPATGRARRRGADAP